MGKVTNATHQAKAERLKHLIEMSQLTFLGFGTLVGVSEKYIYAILNGNKPFSPKFEDKVDKAFGFLPDTFSIPDQEFDPVKVSEVVRKFLEENIHNLDDYSRTALKRSTVIAQLIEKGFFQNAKTVRDVSLECEQSGHSFSSSDLTKSLVYAAHKGLLLIRKQPMLRLDGTEGDRLVNYYLEPEPGR